MRVLKPEFQHVFSAIVENGIKTSRKIYDVKI